MGVEPFLVASSINIIVAQRLARRICEGCKKQIEVNPDILVNVGLSAAEAKHVQVFQGGGCGRCSGTGYKGRIALYECLTMKETIKEFVLNGASSAEIKREAIKGGMITLRQSGIHNLKAGITTIEEIVRVTAAD
jgi:type IV pilus assembly protein PilB